MARYDVEHKGETRRRIVETAGRRLKQDGIDGSGIAALMSDAGLTNGAFYAHFESKDDLVASVVADQLRAQRAVLSSLPAGQGALEEFIRDYLSPRHRDQPSTGCPSAALLDEIGRCDDAVRRSNDRLIDLPGRRRSGGHNACFFSWYTSREPIEFPPSTVSVAPVM